MSCWYVYLMLYYGPTSIFAVLGKEYVEVSHGRPWLLSERFIETSLCMSIISAALPMLAGKIVLSSKGGWSALLLSDLRPRLREQSSLAFGIIGTAVQLCAIPLIAGS